nr:hypothetical protein Iba_chr07dCG3130 [Ipomoea batatas]
MGARRRTGGGDWRVRGARRSEIGTRKPAVAGRLGDWKWIREQRRPAWLWLSETTTRLRLCGRRRQLESEVGAGRAAMGARRRTGGGDWRVRGARMAAADCRQGKLGDLGN